MLSVVMATYHGARYLRAQLESIAAQTLQPDELVLSDDGSADDTLAIAEAFRRVAPFPVRILRTGGRFGSTQNFSHALLAAHGDIIALADQDDVWLPDKLARSMQAMEALQAEAGADVPLLVYGDLAVVDEELHEIAPSLMRRQHFTPEPDGLAALRVLACMNFAVGCTMLLNRALRDIACPIPTGAVFHDWWLPLACAAAGGRLGYVDAPLLRYRQHGSNVVGAQKYVSWERLQRLRSPAWLSRRIDEAFQQAQLARLLARAGSDEAALLDGLAAACAAGDASAIRRLGVHMQGRAKDIAFSLALRFWQMERRTAVFSGRISGIHHRFHQCCHYARAHGLCALAEKIAARLDERPPVPYEAWRQAHLPSADDLAAQRAHCFSYAPLVSILVPAWRTPLPLFTAMIASVRAQTYGRWELIIADGSGEDTSLAAACRAAGDVRIHYERLAENGGISANTNAALAQATGDYIALLDHDDMLAPDALYEVVAALQGESRPELLYTDEDKVDATGTQFFEPHFKPGVSPALFCSNNYFCHLSVVARTLVDRAGLSFDPAMDGAQDYDFLLRASEQARAICHIPRVLYHWRVHQGSTAGAGAAKPYTHEAGRRAVAAYLARRSIPAVVEDGAGGSIPNFYRVRYTEAVPIADIAILHWDDQTTAADLAAVVAAAHGTWLVFLRDGLQSVDMADSSDPVQELVRACHSGGAACSGARLLCGRRTLPMGAFWTGNGLQLVGGRLLRWSSGYQYHSFAAHELDMLHPYALCLSRAAYEQQGGLSSGAPPAQALAALSLRLTAAGGRCVYVPTAAFDVPQDMPAAPLANVPVPQGMPKSMYWNENAAYLVPYLKD